MYSKQTQRSAFISLGILIGIAIVLFIAIKFLVVPELIYRLEMNENYAIWYALFIYLLIMKAFMAIGFNFTSYIIPDVSTYKPLGGMLPIYFDYHLGKVFDYVTEVEYFQGFEEYIDPDGTFMEKIIDFFIGLKDWMASISAYSSLIINIITWLYAIGIYLYMKFKLGFYYIQDIHLILVTGLVALMIINLVVRYQLNARILKETEYPSVNGYWAYGPISLTVLSLVMYFIVGILFPVGSHTLYNFILLVSTAVIPICFYIYSKRIHMDMRWEDAEDINNFTSRYQ